MKVLHVVAGDLGGGAARGALWLHLAQRAIGIDSTLLTSGQNESGCPSVITLAGSPTQRLKFSLLSQLGMLPARFYRKRQPSLFNTGFEGIDLTKHDAYRDADLIHLHWINGLVRMRTLRKVKKPIVWTMRDMWPLTGGCHYSMNCDRYKVGCGQCPQLASRSLRDLSWLVVRNKRTSLPRRMQLVGISNWLSSCAADSYIFQDFRIETISNNIDTSQFFPVETKLARQMLGLPDGKRIILTGAQQIRVAYKGFDLFVEATKGLSREDVHLVLVGKISADDLSLLRQSHTSLAFLADDVSLRLAYSAADVFVAPSRMEAFGKMLAEAMACGTPVVCFDAAGPADIVDHKVTGYKARPFAAEDLRCGIQWVLDQDPAAHERLREDARERALALFDSQVIAQQYAELYRQMCR